MSARIYSNENFDLRVVRILRKLGHDVLTSMEAGRANLRIPDDQVLAFAISEQRAVLTFNRLHFLRLHQQTRGAHQGIIVCSTDPDAQALALRIHEALSAEDTLTSQLLRVNRPVK